MKRRLQWQLNFVLFKSPEDISGSLRKLDQLIEKAVGQSFQLGHGQYFKPFLQNKQKQYTPIVCCCFFNPIASWTSIGECSCRAIQRILSVILQESRNYQGNRTIVLER